VWVCVLVSCFLSLSFFFARVFLLFVFCVRFGFSLFFCFFSCFFFFFFFFVVVGGVWFLVVCFFFFFFFFFGFCVFLLCFWFLWCVFCWFGEVFVSL